MTSGIYKITNKFNGKIYIGQSMNIEKRLKSHFQNLNNGDHINEGLQSEFNFYDKYNFHAEIYEECPPHLLNRRESTICYTLDVWNPEIGYNIGRLLDYRNVSLEDVEEYVDTYFQELYRNNNKIIEKHGEVFISIEKFMERLDLNRNDTFVLFKSLTGEHEEAIGLSFDIRQGFGHEGIDISLLGRPHLSIADFNL
jgi:hypothetical protein